MGIFSINCLIHIICCISGSLIGVGVSFLVNCTLIEISKNKFFAIYFSFLFSIIGLYILIRSIKSLQTDFQNLDYIQVNLKENFRHKYLLSLSCLIIFAAFFAFSLHMPFLIKLHYLFKVPIFATLGIAVCFSLTICIIDIINFGFHIIQSKDYKPPINTTSQIIPMIISSCFMGMLFGAIFGIMDIEDVAAKYIKDYLLKEENYCIPIGVIFGGLSGLLVSMGDKNETQQNEISKEFSPIKQDEEIEI